MGVDSKQVMSQIVRALQHLDREQMMELRFVIDRSLGCPLPTPSATRAKKSGASKYKGVSPYRGKWMANITMFGTGRSKYLGLFETEEEAALAYNQAAKERDGEDNAILNEVEGTYAS